MCTGMFLAAYSVTTTDPHQVGRGMFGRRGDEALACIGYGPTGTLSRRL
jgi:hypothetical protein